MPKNDNIPSAVIQRLTRYYRLLGDLKDKGLYRISSNELSKRMGLTASQIRQDLNYFGGYGQKGYGYNIEVLHAEIADILGLGNLKKIILIGAGNLGKTIATHFDLAKHGFQLVGIFDKKPSLIGQTVKNIPIRNIEMLDDFCKENRPSAAILCIPKGEAKEITSSLVELGIKGIWNFSHYNLVPEFPQIKVENVHLSDSLMSLCYNMENNI